MDNDKLAQDSIHLSMKALQCGKDASSWTHVVRHGVNAKVWALLDQALLQRRYLDVNDFEDHLDDVTRDWLCPYVHSEQ
jgi:hypothetical protein